VSTETNNEPNFGDGPDVVLCDIDGGVATLTLNRPARRNAWTFEMERRLFDLLDDCDADPAVRVIVLTGAGRSFCAGMDMAHLDKSSQSTTPFDTSTWRTRPMFHARSLRKPTIAAVNGACAGIGLVQALSCDIRFAAADAKIAPSFTRRGLHAEFGVSWLLTRLVGTGRAAELLISSRTITGAEAFEIDMVNRVYPDAADVAARAQSYAADLATNCSPLAMAAVKEQLAADWSRSLTDADADGALRIRDPELRHEFREGVASFIERRPPHFRALGAADR
jgi:enoyl-CoA hydratase/carnithine racemase